MINVDIDYYIGLPLYSFVQRGPIYLYRGSPFPQYHLSQRTPYVNGPYNPPSLMSYTGRYFLTMRTLYPLLYNSNFNNPFDAQSFPNYPRFMQSKSQKNEKNHKVQQQKSRNSRGKYIGLDSKIEQDESLLSLSLDDESDFDDDENLCSLFTLNPYSRSGSISPPSEIHYNDSLYINSDDSLSVSSVGSAPKISDCNSFLSSSFGTVKLLKRKKRKHKINACGTLNSNSSCQSTQFDSAIKLSKNIKPLKGTECSPSSSKKIIGMLTPPPSPSGHISDFPENEDTEFLNSRKICEKFAKGRNCKHKMKKFQSSKFISATCLSLS